MPTKPSLASWMLSIILISVSVSAHSNESWQSALQNLKTGQIETLTLAAKAPTLLSFFSVDCPWCIRQIKTYRELDQHCSHTPEVVMIGLHASRLALRNELRRYHANFPAYSASADLLNWVGDIRATPTTFLLNHQGEILKKWQGYQSAAQLCTLKQARLKP